MKKSKNSNFHCNSERKKIIFLGKNDEKNKEKDFFY